MKDLKENRTGLWAFEKLVRNSPGAPRNSDSQQGFPDPLIIVP